MKTHWIPIIFAAGLGVGWLMFSGGMRENEKSAGNKSAAPIVTKRDARPVTSPHEARFRSFARKLPKLSTEDKEAFKKSLAPKDRTAAIEAMLAQAGPSGIPSGAKSMLDDILKTWVDDDFDAAWAWCRQIESDDTRKYVASKLLDQIADKDPDRALALYLEMTAGDSSFSSSVVPFKILRMATSKDAASFLNVLGKLPLGQSGGGSGVQFAEDFDFQQAADGITALQRNHPGKRPTVFPTNFLSSWAARDADAAFAWFSKDPGTVTYENFGSLPDGIEKQGVSGASYTWAADKLNAPGTARDAMIRSLTRSNSDRLRNTIHSIAQAMPDAASGDRFLGDVVTTAIFGDPAITFGYALTQMSSPAVRLETLQRLGKNKRLDTAKIPDAQLQQWGLTRQQVEQLQPSGR